MLSVVLIDYDLTTKELRRIIVPENDSQLHFHPAGDSSWGQISMPVANLAIDLATGIADGRSNLQRAAAALQAVTGVWPPNISQ